LERPRVRFVHESEMALAAANVLSRIRAKLSSTQIRREPRGERDARFVHLEHDIDGVLGPTKDRRQVA
jgi:hypothetical protein